MKNAIKNVILILIILTIFISSNNQVFADYSDFQKLYMPQDDKEEENDALLVERIANNVMNGKISEETAITAIKNGEAGTAFIKDNINIKFRADEDYNTAKDILKDRELINKLKTKKQLEKAAQDLENYLTTSVLPNGTAKEKKESAARAKKYAKLFIAYKKLQLINTKIKNTDFSNEENVEKKLNEIKKEEKKEEEKDKKAEEAAEYTDSPIYVQPNSTTTGNGSSESSLEDMINDADSFVNSGTAQYDQNSMQNFSKTIYNIMFTIGVFVAVIMGGAIGIKLMISSASEKAEAKKLLVPYVVGCVVVFGGFGIWKLVVTILQGI